MMMHVYMIHNTYNPIHFNTDKTQHNRVDGATRRGGGGGRNAAARAFVGARLRAQFQGGWCGWVGLVVGGGWVVFGGACASYISTQKYPHRNAKLNAHNKIQIDVPFGRLFPLLTLTKPITPAQNHNTGAHGPQLPLHGAQGGLGPRLIPALAPRCLQDARAYQQHRYVCVCIHVYVYMYAICPIYL